MYVCVYVETDGIYYVDAIDQIMIHITLGVIATRIRHLDYKCQKQYYLDEIVTLNISNVFVDFK